jgi:hypothetical protein
LGEVQFTARVGAFGKRRVAGGASLLHR